MSAPVPALLLVLALAVGTAAILLDVVEDSGARPDGYRERVMSDEPAGYWRLGETDGRRAADETGTQAGRYIGGVVLRRARAADGDFDTAAAFDGENDTVRIPHSPEQSSSEAMSLEGWLHPVRLPSDSATVIGKEDQYVIRLTATGAIVFGLWKNGLRELSTADGVIAPRAWSHVVATFDATTMTIYVNGRVRATRALAAPAEVSSEDIHLGSTNGSSHWFEGGLDEVAVYTRALPARRVRAHHERARVVATTQPRVRLDAPASGSTMHATPIYAGSAGTDPGDATSVTITVHRGDSTSGQPLQTLTAPVRLAGTFSIAAPSGLASGRYTAKAEQARTTGTTTSSTERTFRVDAGADPVLLAAGDIAGCDTTGDEATARLLDGLPGTVAPLGDLAYEYATESDFAHCYDQTWGRHRPRTRPVPGSHDYAELNSDAEPYYAYFGSAAGDPEKGYYSYDLGTWHVVALNSVCQKIGGCDEGSPQERWLRADLAANAKKCTLAYWHDPRFSSGAVHGSNSRLKAFWQALYDFGAEVVLSGHEHSYER
ncbi:MAG: metallophosphoesterase, partial [Actinomycetota bacterium]|nr:metallophosphoesterase [Actinomycetota bacterium]